MVNGEDNRTPGSGVKNALLLTTENEDIPAPIDPSDTEEEILFATTLVMTRNANGRIEVGPLGSCEVEGCSFKLDMRQLEVLVMIMNNDLQSSKTINALAEALTSQEG